MYRMVAPLAVSAHAPSMCGELDCFSLHNKVINLINQQNQIITLHCYNSGLSPMGWLLKSDDFYYLYELIEQNHPIKQDEKGNLIIANICLLNHYRQLTLTPKNKCVLSQTVIHNLLKPIDTSTGLFGSVTQNITENLPDDLKHFTQQFVLLLEQKQYDLSPFIGLGPGLTPSYDDMIVGILAVLHSDPRVTNQLQSLQYDYPISRLEQLTTKISATFLNYAIKGVFTSNMLAVISLIRQYKPYSLSINKLLSYGHTSGADSLLGIWLGAFILRMFDFNKEVITC